MQAVFPGAKDAKDAKEVQDNDLCLIAWHLLSLRPLRNFASFASPIKEKVLQEVTVPPEAHRTPAYSGP
jgi:hypothetical protein